MSKIDEQIKKLREQEKRLELETKKILFLQHILDSARDYDHANFKEVKDEVVAMLEKLVEKAVESPEASVLVQHTNTSTFKSDVPVNSRKEVAPKKVPEPGMSIAEKANFAMDHRHLAGKTVTVENDKNMVIKGKVVGLDAPFVVVAVEGGPNINVPREKISLV